MMVYTLSNWTGTVSSIMSSFGNVLFKRFLSMRYTKVQTSLYGRFGITG